MKSYPKIFLFVLFVVCSTPFPNSKKSNGENEYDVRNIPLRLLNDAGAVIRKYDTRFEVEDYNSALEIVTKAVTIFNKNEQYHGELKLWYDKFRYIDELDAVIYNSRGEEIRDMEESDLKDYSDFERYSVYSDNRVKLAELYYDKFPYTIEFTYEIKYDGYLEWPSWYSRYSIDPVEKTSFEVVTPTGYNLRFWCNQEKVKPEISEDGNKKIYRWFKQNLLPLPEDVLEEDIEDFATIVKIAPSDFEIGGYKGNMDSWKTFGSWYNNLCSGKNILPETAIKEITEKIVPGMDTKKMVEELYTYLQSRTRYVSVQLGIGSWQPYDVSYVHKNGYGDCKALSNYMVSVLKQSGITAYPVLIHNGHHRIPLITEFPSNQFNHVIVCVPLEKDTIWLECTSQIMPPGNIGWSNENRDALMITPEGGVIVRTPRSSSENNVQQKNGDIKLSANGVAYVKTDIKWFGNQHNFIIQIANESIPDEQEKWIKNLLEVPDIKLKDYSFKQEEQTQDEISLLLDLTLQNYGSVSGKRIFFNPNLMERRTSIPKDVPERFSPVRVRYPYINVDSIKYTVPEKYKVEAVPKEVNIQTSFGSFTSKTIDKGDSTILYVRCLEIKDYTIPAKNYFEYQKFFAEVVNADKQQVVLVKSEQ